MKTLLRIAMLLVVLTVGAVGASFTVYRAPSVVADSTVFIERGTGARAMLAQLHRAQLLPAPWKILLPVALSGQHGRFKAGEYAFTVGQSPQAVLAKIAHGDVVIHALTIPEGYSVAQVRAAMMAEPLLTGDLPAIIAEGSIAPDTIHFARGDARAAVLARLQAQQREILASAWARRAPGLPYATPEQALIMASIIEAETGIEAERRRVAAVYVNRLRIGMLLQADPTVAYGIAPEGMTRPLTRADLKRPTPYNTYIHTDLPPTPISNPGKASIEAALNPLASDELFFVATGNGGHWFAKTMAEHHRNVLKYRATQKARAR